MRILALLGVWIVASAFMVTSASNPLLFTREVITIVPKQAPLDEDGFPGAPRLDITYLAEVRDERALHLEEMHSLTQLAENSAIAIAYNAPTVIALPRYHVRQKMDVLFVDDEGTILQMLPSHIPAESNAQLISDTPIKAWVYLKEGQIAARDIRPQDRVEGSMFTPPPPIIK